MSMTEISKKDVITLAKILYIYYLLHFSKDVNKIKILLNLNNKIKTMILVYISKLGLRIYYINV